MNTTGNDVLSRFVRGEATWAEVEGFRFEDAQRIAQVGCDLIAAQRYSDALTIFTGLVAMNPKDPAAHLAQGIALEQLERIGEALEEYEATLRIDPANGSALLHRGLIRLRRGQREGMGDISQAVLGDPKGKTEAGKRAQAILRSLALKAAATRPTAVN